MPAICEPEYTADVVLRDGSTLHLRPVRPDDDERLLDLLRHMSAEALYYRFMTVPRIDLAKAAQLTKADFEHQYVLAGECAGSIVAIAGYYADESSPKRAEVAFAVADAWQGRGIGTRLLECLAEIGRRRDIRIFDAYVLGDNRRMMDVFLESGFTVAQQLEKGVFHVTLQLEPSKQFADRAAARSQQAAAASMRWFFEPKTVAVIGANRVRGRIGSEILHNLRSSGLTGTLVAVHPEAEAIDGIRAYPTVTAIPGPVDLAVIAVPAAHVASVLDDCIVKGVKAVVVISAGFAETGGPGKILETALVEKIRAAGIRMIGPNCMGIINTDPDVQLNATFSPVYPPQGRVAFSTQSGALGLAILEYVKRLNLGISSFASIGNKADVSSNDLIQYWAADERTDVILLYLESFGNPRKFAQIARRVGQKKPIVTVKAGRSTAGARAASSHTGARATSDTLTDTLLRQSGVIRTHTLEEMFDVAALLASQPVPAGRRVAIVTNAGGPGILAADACEANGLRVIALAQETMEKLRAFLPASASVANPVDMIASASADHFRRTVEIVLADPNVDSVITIFIPPIVTAASDVADAIRIASAESRKPVLATFMGAPAGLMMAPIPTYIFPESAAVALARVTTYGEWLRKPHDEPPQLDGFDRDHARGIVTAALAEGGGWLTPARAQALLEACGVRVAGARTAVTADEAAAAAHILGYPIVLKAVGPSLVHKTDVGGVKLGLADDRAVRDAFNTLKESLGDRLESVLVQRMLPAGVEMVVGGVNDAALGPVIMGGTGGVFVELFADTVFRMCPLTEADAEEMVGEMKGRALLRGYRGSTPADEAAYRQALLAISQLLDACPEIHEMDINPIIVGPNSATAVDVRVRVGTPASPSPQSRRISY
jgi:acetate---CoA ligase (ADP-forming)